MEQVTGIRWYAALRSCFPILTWLPRYNLTWLKMDLIAGLTVGLTAVPQALAYAEVAGLPVQVRTSMFFHRLRLRRVILTQCLFVFQYGLYSAFMGGFIYCVFGTSKDITLGPTAIMSLLCSAYIGGDPVFAVVLTLLCGIIQAGMALLRLGEMENWLKGKVHLKIKINSWSFMLTETTQNFFSKMEIKCKAIYKYLKQILLKRLNRWLSQLCMNHTKIGQKHDQNNNINSSPKNEYSVINYSPSHRSKPVRPSFIFRTQIKIIEIIIWNPIAFWPCIDSNATDSFKTLN